MPQLPQLHCTAAVQSRRFGSSATSCTAFLVQLLQHCILKPTTNRHTVQIRLPTASS